MIPYKDRTIIINDGSTDSTKEIVYNLGFKCIDNLKNIGELKCIVREIEYALKNNIRSDFNGCCYYNDQYIPTNKWASNLFAAVLYAELI